MHDETNARCGQGIPCRRNAWNMGWNVYGACMEYVRIMLEYVRNMYGICMEYVWHMHGIYMEYVWNMYGTGMEYQWNMHGMSMKYL